jgi:hypothetical protein
MPAPSWKFIVTDLLHNQIGELTDYYEASIIRRLNGVDSGSLRVRADHPMFALLSSQQCMIKAYRDGAIQANMYVWAAEITGEGDKISLAVTLTAPAIRLENMFLAPGGAPAAIKLAVAEDRYRIWHHVFNTAMEGTLKGGIPFHPEVPESDPNYAGYVLYQTTQGNIPTLPCHVPYGLTGTTMLYDDYDDRTNTAPMSQRLQMFSQGAAGFDWYWIPTEPQWWWKTQTAQTLNRGTYPDVKTTTISGSPWTAASSFATIPVPAPDGVNPLWHRSVATMLAAQKVGANKTATAVFEYGTGEHNLTGFKFSGTRQYQANWMTQRLAGASQAGQGQYSTNAFADNGKSLLMWGKTDAIGQFDVADTTYLQSLLNEAVALRKQPMRRLEITPISSYGAPSDPPNFGVDFGLGDTVTTRIVNPVNGVAIVNGVVRVHGVAWTIKESGAETMSVTITPEN